MTLCTSRIRGASAFARTDVWWASLESNQAPTNYETERNLLPRINQSMMTATSPCAAKRVGNVVVYENAAPVFLRQVFEWPASSRVSPPKPPGEGPHGAVSVSRTSTVRR